MNAPSGAEARWGRVIEQSQHGGGASGRLGLYYVRDEDDHKSYVFDYRDIVTESFRTAVVGERVRFYVDDDQPHRARYVIRTELPDPSEFYWRLT